MPVYGDAYACDHPLYKRCTLYLIGNAGLAVIQQRYDEHTKAFWWDAVDPWLANDIYMAKGFVDYFNKHADAADNNGLYPTVSVRKLMWALRMKPLKKEYWEIDI